MRSGEHYKIDLGGCCPKEVEITAVDHNTITFKIIKTGKSMSMSAQMFAKKSYKYTARR